MDAQTFLDELRDEHETELSRLGSSKAVYALTEGEMDGDAIRVGTTRELQAVTPILETWAEAADGDAADCFADVAAALDDWVARLDEAAVLESEAVSNITAETLDDCDDEQARAAGLAAALLVLAKLSEQLVGFFVGDADRSGAAEFRELRDDLREHRDDVASLLDTRCTAEADWVEAHETAAVVVEGAYDWYVGTLEAMGIEPKNVC
jgi:hypothetical protein